MNCIYCGAPVSLEEKFCPNCGRPNQAAAQHSQDMANYKREFENTRKGVYATMRAYKGMTASLLVFLIAIVIMLIAIALNAGVYSIGRNQRAKETKAHASEVAKELDEMIENKDYVTLAGYAEYHQVSNYKLEKNAVLGKYYPVIRMARQYQYFYNDVMKTLTTKDLNTRKYVYSNINTDISGIYKLTRGSEGQYLYDYGDTELVDYVAADIEELTDAVLIRYLGFTEEETDEFKTMTEARRAVMIEDKLDPIISKMEGEADE